MSVAYQHLALSAVQPGMILSDEILDKQGQILLPKGAVLTSRTIALLPSHGIESLCVLVDALDTNAMSQPAPAQLEQRLARLFRKHAQDDDLHCATGELRRLIANFRLGSQVPE